MRNGPTTPYPTLRELRKIGQEVGGIFAALPLWGLWRDYWVLSPGRIAFLVLGLTLVVLGAAAPAVLAHPHRAWMAFARLLSRVTSPVSLTLFFFLVITPVGLLVRAFGHDALARRRKPDGESYWLPRAPDPRGPERYKQPF